MSSCRAFVSRIVDYVDGALDVSLRSECDHHLQQCSRCRVLLDTTRKTVQLYHDAFVAEVPPEVERRVLLAIEAIGRRPVRASRKIP